MFAGFGFVFVGLSCLVGGSVAVAEVGVVTRGRRLGPAAVWVVATGRCFVVVCRRWSVMRYRPMMAGRRLSVVESLEQTFLRRM